MPKFGFSAFLKIANLNDRPQRTAIRNRIGPSTGGYDYHKSLRLLSHDMIFEGQALAEVVARADNISKDAERNSAKSALRRLATWRSENPGTIVNFGAATYESPNKIFKVEYTPNFGIEIGGIKTAVHIWNTKSTELNEQIVLGALSLFPGLYRAEPPDQLAVLSLQNGRLYRLVDVSASARLGVALVDRFERIFNGFSTEDRPSAGDQPTPPPR